MEVDALNSSHPVSTPVEDPAQILEMFDDVSYVKVKSVTDFVLSCTDCTIHLHCTDFSQSFIKNIPEPWC